MSSTDITPARAAAGVLFDGLLPQPPDAVLAVSKMYREDPRPTKIDVGVGVYKDEQGRTPVFAAMKAAERRLLETQDTKAYLGPEGDFGYLDRLAPIAFGTGAAAADLFGVQTPGGTGALRLAAELAKAGRPDARIWLGAPSWPIHAPIFAEAGLDVATFRHFDPKTQALTFDETMATLGGAAAGDVVLLHGCCHNPSGANPTTDQWRELTRLILARGLVPLIDLAYQGLGDGLDEDAAGLRIVMEAVDNAMVAYSCDKNFGLYRERTGALFVRARGHAEVVRTNILKIARCAWSMPPDHGAAAVRLILEDEALTASWRHELEACRLRLQTMREALADADPRFEPIRNQRGMFSMLALTPGQVEALRRDHGVYMTGNGRINIAGLKVETIAPFAAAYDAVLRTTTA
jgi:aromatic-amino-acid transaminase